MFKKEKQQKQEKQILDKNKIEDNTFIVMADILNYNNLYTNYFLKFAKNKFPEVYEILTTEDCRDLFVVADNVDVLENAVYAYLNDVVTIKRITDSIAEKKDYHKAAFQNYVMNNTELASQMLVFAEAEELESSGVNTSKPPKIDAGLVADYEKSNYYIHPENVDKKKSVLKKLGDNQEGPEPQPGA